MGFFLLNQQQRTWGYPIFRARWKAPWLGDPGVSRLWSHRDFFSYPKGHCINGKRNGPGTLSVNKFQRFNVLVAAKIPPPRGKRTNTWAQVGVFLLGSRKKKSPNFTTWSFRTTVKRREVSLGIGEGHQGAATEIWGIWGISGEWGCGVKQTRRRCLKTVYWLVVWNIFLFSYILGIIIPID